MDIINKSNDNEGSVTSEYETNVSAPLKPNQPVVVVWDVRGAKKWFVGFFLDNNEDGTYRIDHLERVSSRGNTKWQWPSACDDIQDAEEVQILPIQVLGDWDFTSDKPYFLVSNAEDIVQNFEQICELFNLVIDE